MADVSVVIPTYNRADLLPRAIDSALAQTAPPVEIIIVDDGSTDDTPAVVMRYAERHAGRVRSLRIPNGGVARARNAGIAAARSQWVALLDSDDEWRRPSWRCRWRRWRPGPRRSGRAAGAS
jgi:glycosyltransferase involved in cell wall biosynthesis